MNTTTATVATDDEQTRNCPTWCNNHNPRFQHLHTRRAAAASTDHADLTVFVQRSDTHHHGQWHPGPDKIGVTFYARTVAVPADITGLTADEAEALALQWLVIGATAAADALQAAVHLIRDDS